MKPADTLLLGVAVLAAVLFIGGVIDVFRVPVSRRRRRRRKSDSSGSLPRRRKGTLRDESHVLTLRSVDVPAWLVFTRPAPARHKASPEHAGAELTEAVPTLSSRSRLFVASTVCLAVILGMFLLRGGGAVSVQPPELSDLGPRRQAAALAARGNYEGAWRLYYQALQATPEDVSLWYGLGVTLSHLNQRKETEQAFQYVVRHGRRGSEEVRLARRWLVRSGVLGEPVAFTTGPEPALAARGDAATVKGKVTWGAPEPNGPPMRVQLLLAGLSGAAEGKRLRTRAVLGASYRFERVPPGSYRLIGEAAGQHVWDLTLTVEDGKEVILDLGEDNSSNSIVSVSR